MINYHTLLLHFRIGKFYNQHHLIVSHMQWQDKVELTLLHKTVINIQLWSTTLPFITYNQHWNKTKYMYKYKTSYMYHWSIKIHILIWRLTPTPFLDLGIRPYNQFLQFPVPQGLSNQEFNFYFYHIMIYGIHFFCICTLNLKIRCMIWHFIII